MMLSSLNQCLHWAVHSAEVIPVSINSNCTAFGPDRNKGRMRTFNFIHKVDRRFIIGAAVHVIRAGKKSQPVPLCGATS